MINYYVLFKLVQLPSIRYVCKFKGVVVYPVHVNIIKGNPSSKTKGKILIGATQCSDHAKNTAQWLYCNHSMEMHLDLLRTTVLFLLGISPSPPALLPYGY